MQINRKTLSNKLILKLLITRFKTDYNKGEETLLIQPEERANWRKSNWICNLYQNRTLKQLEVAKSAARSTGSMCDRLISQLLVQIPLPEMQLSIKILVPVGWLTAQSTAQLVSSSCMLCTPYALCPCFFLLHSLPVQTASNASLSWPSPIS